MPCLCLARRCDRDGRRGAPRLARLSGENAARAGRCRGLARRPARTEFGRLDAGGHVYLDYTGGGLYAESQLARAHGAAAAARLRQPALEQPDLASHRPSWSSQARRPCSRFFNADARRVRASIFTRERERGAQAGGRGVPVHAPAAATCSPSTTTTRSTASASSPARAARDVTYVPVVAARAARRRRRPSCAALDRRAAPAATTCSPTRPSRTSPASSIRSTGSSRRTSAAGTCCSTPRRSCRRTGSTSAAWQPDFVALSFYKMFGYPTGVGASSRGARRWPSCERPWFAGGTIVAASVQRERHQSASGRGGLRGRHDRLPQPARRRDRPAPPRADRDRRDPPACPDARELAARRRWILSGTRTALVRRASTGPATARIAVPRSRSTCSIRTAALSTSAYVDRVARRAHDLAADRLLLQPGRRRGRLHDLARDARRRRVRGRHEPRRLHRRDWIALWRCRPSLARLGFRPQRDIDRFEQFAREFVDLETVPADPPPRSVC